MKAGRVEGVDVARGIATVVMIEAHAYAGWVAPAHRSGPAYGLTRLLATLPLPAFLVLAGVAVAHRVDTSVRRAEPAARVRTAIVKRGLSVVAWGYATSVLYAALDGAPDLATLLRADVLQVIGLSIALVAWLGIRPSRSGGSAASTARIGWTALGVGLTVTVVCPWASRIAANVTGPARYLVGLVADVPGVTRMPVVPLAAWLCVGVGAGLALIRWRHGAPDDRFAAQAGAPARALWVMGAAALVVSVAGYAATRAVLGSHPGALTREQPAIWLNVVDLAGRGVLVLAAGALVTPRLPRRVRAVLLRLGQASLFVYVFHIPFCYGRLGGPLRGHLGMAAATVGLAALTALSYAAVMVRDTLRSRWRPAAAGRGRAQ